MPAATALPGARAAPGTRQRPVIAMLDPVAARTKGWLSQLAMTRVLGAAVAVTLLAVHHVTDHDPALIVLTIGWTVVSLGLFAAREDTQRRPSIWVLDGAVAIALVWLSEDWRSPFYIIALTALILPATSLRFRSALLWGCGFMLAYLAVAMATELNAGTLRSSIRVETVATHLMVPIVVTLALAYAAELLNRLKAERERSERLAIQAERQRIAWELHDSAKQRVHAAHLVLSAAVTRATDGVRDGIEHALGELGAAAADMDTSVSELRAPLDSRPVGDLLRQRALELAAVAGTEIHVSGDLPRLPPLVAVHTYRIAAEALTNAVRHSRAGRIEVRLVDDLDAAVVEVIDDGVGLPVQPRPGSHGLRTMRSRAESIDAAFRLSSGADGRGTAVTLALPPIHRQGTHG